jgi:hypothetical protein
MDVAAIVFWSLIVIATPFDGPARVTRLDVYSSKQRCESAATMLKAGADAGRGRLVASYIKAVCIPAGADALSGK